MKQKIHSSHLYRFEKGRHCRPFLWSRFRNGSFALFSSIENQTVVELCCEVPYSKTQFSGDLAIPANNSINYVELCARELEATKQFFGDVFGWGFEDYGPDYSAITDAGLDGGFYRGELKSTYENSGAIVVLFADDLEDTLARVEAGCGIIEKPIFSFSGVRRFHFIEPSGNELAMWSDK